jgi:hypothetical protein
MGAVRISKLSPNAVAIRYKVPRRTLRAYLAENKQDKSDLGRKTVLSTQQEKELFKRINKLAQIGYPITLKIKRICVFTYCEKNNIPNPFLREKGMAGRAWLEVFFRRNPMTASRKAQYLNPGRAQKSSRFIVNDYFANLKTTMEELGVMSEPECVYNVDKMKNVDCAFTNSLFY